MAKFKDRKDAGEQLAEALKKYKNQNPIVIGIPRGGVETAYYVAKFLDAELSIIVTRKLGYPHNPELAFGALAEDGSLYISDSAAYRITEDEINKIIEQQNQEIQRRIRKLRAGKSLPALKGKIVILVDDGIATGATLFASIMVCKNQKAEKIIVAAPVSGTEIIETLRKQVDEVIILETIDEYYAVSQGYDNFSNLTDDEALQFLKNWSKTNTK